MVSIDTQRHPNNFNQTRTVTLPVGVLLLRCCCSSQLACQHQQEEQIVKGLLLLNESLAIIAPLLLLQTYVHLMLCLQNIFLYLVSICW